MFGIDDDFLLKDYTDYYMDKPPVINTNEGIATLPVNTNVSNQGEGGDTHARTHTHAHTHTPAHTHRVQVWRGRVLVMCQGVGVQLDLNQ